MTEDTNIFLKNNYVLNNKVFKVKKELSYLDKSKSIKTNINGAMPKSKTLCPEEPERHMKINAADMITIANTKSTIPKAAIFA